MRGPNLDRHDYNSPCHSAKYYAPLSISAYILFFIQKEMNKESPKLPAAGLLGLC